MTLPDREVALGVLLTFVLHAVVLGGLAFLALQAHHILGAFAVPVTLGFGFFQIVYIVPATMLANRFHRDRIADGLAIDAAVSLALNCACFGLIIGFGAIATWGR